ncbi:sugar-binding transcriptional regulator [Roseobacter sp. EG26]|uniref:sugar-binding transcriptional regulator n=1 Tax=Roseobacter sp. EG26 TaxID=3412477 RepID=UPI003CE4A73B
MPRAPKTNTVDAEEQLLVRLAWACEMEGMTQAAAAEKFGLTRLRVNKSLREARARGIVRVAVNSVYAPCAELEWKLCNAFSLKTASVAPIAGEQFDLHTMIGSSLGQYLASYLSQRDVRLFGMSWGNTLNMATRFMQPINRPDLEIISVMGGLSKGSDLNSFEITTRLADLCNAEHSYFTSPIYAGSRESRDILVAQDVFQSTIEKIRRADGIALAAGDMQKSLLIKDGMPPDIDLESIHASGAVGDIMGYFLSANGDLVDHPINERVLGLELPDLDQIENVILAAGGLNKVPIIRALLTRGCVGTLVTDEHTAMALLDQAK